MTRFELVLCTLLPVAAILVWKHIPPERPPVPSLVRVSADIDALRGRVEFLERQILASPVTRKVDAIVATGEGHAAR